MSKIFTIILLAFLPISADASNNKEVIQQKLAELDDAIENVDLYQHAKTSRIEQLRYKISFNEDSDRAKLLNIMLYAEYAKYDSDAAFDIVIDNMERSLRQQDTTSYASWAVKKAYLYTASGLLKEANDILTHIRPIIPNRTTLLEYYMQRKYLYSHLGQYTAGNNRISPKYYEQKSQYIDSIALTMKPKDQYYLVNKGWQHNNGSDSTQYYLAQLEERFLNSSKDKVDDAMDAYTIAHLYSSLGDSTKLIEYLIYAAIADVKSCNHDIASLQELARILLEHGDIDHSYIYLSFALDKATKFSDRVRVMEIASILDSTYAQLLTKNHDMSRVLVVLLAISAILLFGVVMLSINLKRRNRRLNKTMNDLDELNITLDSKVEELKLANIQLNEAYSNLQELNESLTDSNFIKENYIGNTFEVCSIHIGKMEKIFIKISNLVRHNKIEELRRYCDSSLLVNAEIKLLYQAFDYTFLKIYPSFVERFNELLREDSQIKLRSDETLNTELRIYALNRLGITDNQQIASILHCSLQTVYNNYQKSKNRTDLSSKELLAEIMKIH